MALRLSRRSTIYFILLAGLLAIIWVSYQSLNQATAPAGKALGDLLTALDAGQVASGVFTTDGERVDWVDQHGDGTGPFFPPDIRQPWSTSFTKARSRST